MKELSIEEKAKRYDEALERAKSKLHYPDKPCFVDVVVIFPELAESEDERIRKSIINLVIKSAQNGGMALHKWESQQMIAWLEKQGEQKPANWLQELEDKLANATPKQLAEWKEKYFKEEPAWSEEDKDFMYNTLSNLTELKDRYGEGYGNVGKCIDWLKSLRPQNTWKPSDEQMKALRDINLTGGISYPGQGQELINLYNDLKKLKG